MFPRKTSRLLPVALMLLLIVLTALPAGGQQQELEQQEPAQQELEPEGKDRVIFGQDLKIRSGMTVNDAVVFGGDLTVQGSVANDAVVFGGDIIVEPGGAIGGEAVVFGGRIKLADGAVLKGNQVEISFGRKFLKLFRLNRFACGKFSAGPFKKRLDGCRGMRWLYPLLFFISTLAIGSLFVAFLPDRSARVRRTVTSRMGMSLLTGLAGIVLLPIVLILLGVSLIGIPLIPVCLLLLGFAVTWGFISLGTFIGGRLTGNRDGMSVKTMAAGLLVLSALLFIPMAGKMLNFLFALLGFGAVLLSGFGSRTAPKPVSPSRGVKAAAAPAVDKRKAEPSPRRPRRERDNRDKRPPNRRPRREKTDSKS